jgi:hypothetical protein
MSPIVENSTKGVALVCGQSLKPDGSPPQVLIDRARMAKKLLDQRKVEHVIVAGGDPAGVGHTEASEMAKILESVGVPKERIIRESQSTTTAENVWFALRWIPAGTGQLYIVTSDFHIARATYIIQETLNYFYKMVEDTYKDDPRWTSETKRYPRLSIQQAPTASFCGNDASLNKDGDPSADINEQSLALRASNELEMIESVSSAMYGEPLHKVMYIWPIQVNVSKDPEHEANFHTALAQAMHVVNKLCRCKAPPEGKGEKLHYPLQFPPPASFPTGTSAKDWKRVKESCSKSILSVATTLPNNSVHTHRQ